MMNEFFVTSLKGFYGSICDGENAYKINYK